MVKHFLFCSKLTISCNFQQNFVYYKCNPLIHVNIYSKKILNFLSEIIKNGLMCRLTILIILTSNIHAWCFLYLQFWPKLVGNCHLNRAIAESITSSHLFSDVQVVNFTPTFSFSMGGMEKLVSFQIYGWATKWYIFTSNLWLIEEYTFIWILLK